MMVRVSQLAADLICDQRTRVLTTRREYARRLVPDRFRLPPRMHGTNTCRHSRDLYCFNF